MSNIQKGPDPELVRNARVLISNDAELQGLFSQALKDGHDSEWLTDNLGIRLSARWGAHDFDAAMAVAAVLASEFFTDTERGIAIIDNRTGEAIGRFGPEDVYVPAVVPRESGSMAQPLPRLRPEIAAELVLKAHNTERESNTVDTLLAKTPQTALQRDEGDRRLHVLTQRGRGQILDEIPDLLSDRLFNKTARTAMRSENLSAFETLARVVKKPPSGEGVRLLVETQIRMPLADLQTTNLHYSVHERILSSILGDWARFLGQLYVTRAVDPAWGLALPETVPLESLAQHPCLCWVAPQDVAVRFQALTRDRRVIAVPEWGPLVEVIARSVTVVPDISSMDIKQVEYNDRWAVSVVTPLTLWWEPSNHFTPRYVERPQATGRAEPVR